MSTRADQHERAPRAARKRAGAALEALAEAGCAVADATTLADALGVVADGAAHAAGAETAVVRVLDDDSQQFVACAVVSTSSAVAAELEGTRVSADGLGDEEIDEIRQLPPEVERAARRVGATAALVVPVLIGGDVGGTIELLRARGEFDESERRAARIAAGQAALAIRVFRPLGDDSDVNAALSIAGDALATGADEVQTAEQVARLALDATGALAALLWKREEGRPLALVAACGLNRSDTALVDAAEAAERALNGRTPTMVERVERGLPGGAHTTATLQLGQPPIGALQLLFAPARAPSSEELKRLATFAVRAAQALRTSVRMHTTTAELERTRALLAVVGQAISQLSVTHTLETTVARVAELLGVDRVAVYLREGGRLHAAAGVGLAGPHVRVAERLSEVVLGSSRGSGILAVEDVAADPRLAAAADAASEAGIHGAVAVPLVAGDDAIGLLAVFPDAGRRVTENERMLLSPLAAQLAVAVQNAQLHEQTKRLGDERERALGSERAAARQLRALYEISRSFAQSLSLEATLDAVASTITDVLDVDVAVIGMPDERQELVVPRALHVTDPRIEDAVRAVAGRSIPFGAHPVQRLFRLHEAFQLTPGNVRQIGGPAAGLLAFLEHGWSGAVVPIATPAEVLASMTILSFRPDAPVTAQTVERAEAIAGQAALAIDNARLYQQQKEFADTMQRSLLPRTLPKLHGLELGDAYQSSARVEVGGDVYDFMPLADGRLAVVLGDVTGHGIEAAADMAMAKFVFRSLAREHPEPGDFLQAANDVVVGEIAPGKFITMAYVVVDADGSEVAGAGAGHPPPRVVLPDGTVSPLDVHGLVLGIETGQKYEEVRAPLQPGAAVVLYTDGVLEARKEGELYGFDRLDAIVSAGRELSAQDLAETILADCRDFANNELADDCAVVVIKRTS